MTNSKFYTLVFFLSALFFIWAPNVFAQSQSAWDRTPTACDKENTQCWMNCSSSSNPSVCFDGCQNQLAICQGNKRAKAEERRIERRVRSGSSCDDKYSTCNLNCKGTGAGLMSCLQRCSDRSQTCRDTERDDRRSTSIPRGGNNGYSTPSVPKAVPQTPTIGSGVQNITISNVPFRTVSPRNIQLEKVEAQNPSSDKSDSSRKAALIGAQRAMECISFVKDEKGYLSLKNSCSDLVKYHYCYDKWVPNPDVAGGKTNPFKCDLTGKPSFSGADSLKSNSTKYLPLQAGALRKRTRVGPCMDVVMVDGVRYNHLSATRTGGNNGNKYHCNYYRASVN